MHKFLHVSDLQFRLNSMLFQGKNYTHNQMRELRESDKDSIAALSDWFFTSKVWEYTKYYSYIVFNTPNGFVACYSDNTDNYWRI